MKATLLTSALALCAITAVAADPQPQAPPPEPTHPVSQQTLSAPATSLKQDSPLVAAAKRAGRLGKKPTSVITNDTLLKTGGHFTTTQYQDPLPNPKAAAGQAGATDAPITTNNAPAPATAPPADAAKKAADQKAAKTAKAAAKRAGSDYYGESVENVNEDPAAQEGAMRPPTTPGPARAPKPTSAPAPPRPPSE